jgi:DNA-binding Lrp family transcriptional regulator
LTQLQQAVLAALSDSRQISFSVLRSRVQVSAEELHAALDGLRGLGLVSRLNTVVESYAPRFPGLRVDD